MSEFRRVLLSKRIIIVTVLPVLLCCVFFTFELSNENVTLSGEELSEYVKNYPEFIAKIDENTQNSAMLSALGSSAEYVRANAEKTVADYSRLSGIKLREADNTVIAAFSGFILIDAAVIVVAAAVLICFSEERSKGLANIIRCTKNGRALLSFERSGIIFAAALFTSFSGTFFCVLTGIILRGGIDFSAPIQSIPEFRFCALPINILQYLIINALLKTLGAVTGGFIAQLLLSKLGVIPALGIAGIFGIIEAFLFSAIDGADRLNGFKIANFIPVLLGDFFFKNYYNVNFFGSAVGFLPFAAAIIFTLCAALISLSAILSEKLKGGEIIIPALVKLKEKLSKKSPNPTIFPWELKKILINQKGILIIAAAVFFAANSVLNYGYFIPENTTRDSYYKKYAGEITEEKLEAMRAELNEISVIHDELSEEYIYNLLYEYDPVRVPILVKRLEELRKKILSLNEIIDNAESAREVTLSRGIKTELVKPDTYELLLKNDKPAADKISLFICFCLIGVFSGIYACEAQSNMTSVQRTLKKGRGRLLAAKLGTAAFIAPLVTAGAFAAQVILIGIKSGYNNLGASAQSVGLLRHIPFEITLGGYLALIFVLRMFFAFLLCGIIMFISSRCKTRVSSLAVCAGIIALPAMLSKTGLWTLPGVTDFIGYVM